MTETSRKTHIAIAQIKDLPAILKVQKAAFTIEAKRYPGESLPPLAETVADLVRFAENGVILKAVQNENVIGTVRAQLQDGICQVGRLAVDPGFQNQGIGKALMLALQSYFPQARFELFTGHLSVNTLALYRHLGYKDLRTEKQSEALTLVYLAKEVSEVDDISNS